MINTVASTCLQENNAAAAMGLLISSISKGRQKKLSGSEKAAFLYPIVYILRCYNARFLSKNARKKPEMTHLSVDVQKNKLIDYFAQA